MFEPRYLGCYGFERASQGCIACLGDTNPDAATLAGLDFIRGLLPSNGVQVAREKLGFLRR
jgi:hypothetical protein